MGVSAMQTPEKQILPLAPTTTDPQAMLKWAQDLMRTLQQNLAGIARKANETTAISPLTANLDAGGFDILNVGDITYTGALTGGTGSLASLILTGLTASQSVQTNASKQLVSLANTGTGNNVLATSPTLVTPIIGAATGTSLQLSGLTASRAVATDASKNLVSVANTGTGSNVLAASPALTGTPTAPTAAPGTNTTQLATTAFVTTADNLKANLASPTFTGTPHAPTAGAGTNTTQLATTAFVTTAVAAVAPNYATGNAALSQGGVGTYANCDGGVVATGATTAGSNLTPVLQQAAGTKASSATTLAGTWRNMGNTTTSTSQVTLYLRIS